MTGGLFALLVVIGFFANWVATWPQKGTFPWSIIGWGCWFFASLIWAFPALGGWGADGCLPGGRGLHRAGRHRGRRVHHIHGIEDEAALMPFLALIGPWLLKHWAAVAVSVALAALALYVGTMHARLALAKAALVTERAAHARDVATCAANTKRLTDAIASQNASVAALKAQGAKDTAAAQTAIQQAQAASVGHSVEVRRIVQFKVSPGCAGAEQLRQRDIAG